MTLVLTTCRKCKKEKLMTKEPYLEFAKESLCANCRKLKKGKENG